METKVFTQENAIKWLNQQMCDCINNFEEYNYTAEDTSDIIKDLLEDVEIIKSKNWDFVGIEECAMSPSNINVYEMKRA